LFYVVAELWGSVMLSLLFWQFANQITSTDQAKRFYPMYGFIGNIGLVIAGYLLKKFARFGSLEDSSILISSITWAMVFAVVLIMFFYNHMNVRVLHSSEVAEDKYIKSHSKISLLESFRVILSSRYLGFIVILLFSYGITINMIEGPWKARVREMYPNTSSYAHFMGTLTQFTGVASMVAMIIGANVLRRVSWFSGAILTPMVLSISGIGFFAFVVFDDYIYSHFGEFILMSPLVIAVIFGMLQNVLSKATKYSFFDPTKEMAYIPIDRELKTKGKAAVDIVGARMAKAVGALLQSFLFIIFPTASYSTITPYLMVIFIIVAIIWILDVKMLYEEYKLFFKAKITKVKS
jgi:AAA family ATP:ADP antiporter